MSGYWEEAILLGGALAQADEKYSLQQRKKPVSWTHL